MGVRVDQAVAAAHDTVRHWSGRTPPSSNVTNLRPTRGGGALYDVDSEERSVSLDLWAWSLVLLTLRGSDVHVAVDLADTIEAQLRAVRS